MEEISSRRSSNDDYGGSFGNSLMEPTVHDVLSLELSHHSLGDSYLDPRSFGDGNSFDEFGGVEGRYEIGGGGSYEQAPPQQAPIPQRTQTTHYQGQILNQQQPQKQRRYECPPQGVPQQVQRSVPTYPVKTADPSTCTQYAPVRTLPGAVKSAPRRSGSSRSSHKKEPMDPKTVEDEVARNVSQILSATKQQKLAQEAQQRCGGILPPIRTPNYSCSDCGKGMTSHRNLVRHRQTACYKKVDEWVDRSQCWPEQCNNERDRYSEDSDSLPGMGGGNSLQHSSYSSESSGWCSPNNSYSPSNQMGSLDPANLAPLSLETDDSQTHSSSASHCSSASNGPQTSFTCESCKKSVSSLRSLKRHHTTCKQYIQEYGPPPDSDAPRTRPIRRPKVASSPESEGSGSPSPVISEGRAVPQTAAADSTQKDDDEGVPKQSPAHNTCTDCNRQLCSASNLKRHRATCKMAMTKSESPSSQSSPLPPPSYSHIEIPERERSIINRSYAAAVAASEQVREAARQSQAQVQQQPPQQQRQVVQQQHSQPQQHQPQQQQQVQQQQQQHHMQPQQMQERPRQPQYTAYIVTSPRQKPQPWVTVGEHLRAKHVQQKMLEASGGTVVTQGSVVTQGTLVTQGGNIVIQGGTIVDQGRSVVAQGGSVVAVTVKHEEGGIMIAEQRNGYSDNNGFVNVKIEDKQKVMVEQHHEMKYQEREPQTQHQAPQHLQHQPQQQGQPQQQMQPPQQTQIPMRTPERSQHAPLHHLPQQQQQQQSRPSENGDIPPLDSIITTQPLNGDRVTGVPVLVHDSRNFNARQAQVANNEFQCPECKKTYSCRKNVKRHRMAVHKLTADEITRYPGPTPCGTAVMVDSPQLSPSLPRILVIPKVDPREGFKTETVPLSPSNQGDPQQQQTQLQGQQMQSQQVQQVLHAQQGQQGHHGQNQQQVQQIAHPPQQYRFTQVVQQPRPVQSRPSQDQIKQQEQKPLAQTEVESWRQSREYYDEEESAETARIAAELKRSAEQELAEIAELEEKKIRPELAEADTTTFNEDPEFANRSHHSSPGSGTVSSATSASNALPPLSSWMSSKPLSVEIPYGGHSRSADSSPHLEPKRTRFDSCGDPTPMLGDPCPEDSLSCGDPMLGHGPSSSSRSLDDDCWFKREEVPDSTTCQRADRSTSPCVLMDHADTPALGSLPYSRKRVMAELPSNDPKQARHLCQDCGKFYSSEWNLERHRRESCPTKTNQGSPNATQNDDISVLMGSMRFVLSKAALTRASASFAQLFSVHDPAKGELRVDADPQQFQMILDTYNNPAYLSAENIDRVVEMAVKYKFQVVIDSCAKFIGDDLPKISVMHAIRLAELHKLTSIKQRLFDSISIDVFRSLAADHDYKLMTAELKAELLEKWGTFL